MAGLDYISCNKCGERMIYDGKRDIRESINYAPIFCEKCVKKLEKRIKLLEKHDRRKH